MPKVKVPTYDTFMNPIVAALKTLGGSGTIEEINGRVTEIAGLSDEQLEVILEVIHDEGGTQTESNIGWHGRVHT